MPSPNIPDLSKARQDLPLPDIRIGAFEPSLYGKIIHAALTLLACVIEKMSPKKRVVLVIMIKIIKIINNINNE